MQKPSLNTLSRWMPLSAVRVLFLMLFLVNVAAGQSTASSTAVQENRVLRATLNNGLRVVIVSNPLAPVAAMVMNYLVGSNEAPPGFPGMAHAQEHMMFRGSPGLPAASLSAITAELGGRFNAATRQVATQYAFSVPAQDLELALHTEAIRTRNVTNDDALWAQEKKAIEQEVAQNLSNPQYILYTRLLAALFRGTPYAHDALGTRSSFEKTTGRMLKQFYDAWYAPNNAILVIAGNINPQQTVAKVQQLFAGIPAKKLPARPVIQLQPVAPETIRMPTDAANGQVGIAFRMPGYRNPDFAAAVVLADVLNSQRSALYGLVPVGQALATNFSYHGLPQSGFGMAQGSFPKGANPDRLLADVKQVLVNTATKGVDVDLVEAAKRQEIAAYEFQKNSVSGLASLWSAALAIEGRRSPEEDIQAFSQVTKADVDRVARKYIDLNHAIFAILTPRPSGKPVSKKGFGGEESFPSGKAGELALPKWARRKLSKLEVPRSTLHPTDSRLSNGIRLIVQSESVIDTISVYGYIKNHPDLQAPSGKEGVDRILIRLFPYGTTHLDRLAFQKALDDIAAQETAGTNFSLNVLSSQFGRGVELLADNLLHPALPAQAFKTLQSQMAASVAGQLESPDYLSQRALKKGIYPPHDPTLRQATPSTVRSLTLTDVRKYYEKIFRPDETTIVVIGNVSPARASAVIDKYFGGWKAKGPKPATDLPPVPLNRASASAVLNTARFQDKVILGQTLGLTRKHPDYYALQLGNHVLGGAFYATRLYRDLRENTGLVYSVDSAFDVGKTRGNYLVEYACDPANVSRARTIIQNHLRAMQQLPVSPDELHRAKALLLREMPLTESSVETIAGGFLGRAQLDLPLDEPTRAAQRYMALNARQVQQAFRRWLHIPDFVQVTEGPMPH